MNNWASRLRIGEKIGLGFGVVGLTLLAVVWHDRAVLERVLADSTRLQEVYSARQDQALRIERHLAGMRAAERAFLTRRDPGQVLVLAAQAAELNQAAETLGGPELKRDVHEAPDADLAQTAAAIRALARDYLARFQAIAAAWEVKGLDQDRGLQGAFRTSAHELESLVARQPLAGFETQVLQLRRREKDYLLRGDPAYVQMVDQIVTDLSGRIASAPLNPAERTHLQALLAAYTRDFHALLAQDQRIAVLTAEMEDAAARITPLVEHNLAQANGQLVAMVDRLARGAAADARRGLLLALGATALGLLFAWLITRRIVRTVRTMAGLLDRLTHEAPAERIPTVPDGRDEINHMAIALNTLADHRAAFIHWWRAAMQEATALRDLQGAADHAECQEALGEWLVARRSRDDELTALVGRFRTHLKQVEQVAAHLVTRDGRADAAALNQSVAGIATLLELLESDAPGASLKG